jgi:hypothetical protein
MDSGRARTGAHPDGHRMDGASLVVVNSPEIGRWSDNLGCAAG